MNKFFHALCRSLGNTAPVFFIVLVVLSLYPFYASAAAAVSVTVAIQQVNPDSSVQTVTCAANCTLPLTVNRGLSTAQPLNVQVSYSPGIVVLRFQASNGYFYASDTGAKNIIYTALWAKPVKGANAATYNVTLVQPLAQATALPVLNMAQAPSSHPTLASLQITVTPAP